MGHIAVIIAVAYGILGGVAVVVIGAAVWNSTVGRRREIDAKKLGEREKTWFVIVVVLLAVLLFATIFFTPYAKGRPDKSAQQVSVVAQQFAFVIPHNRVRAGKPVQFSMTAKDVNHGFAVFDPHHVFLFQVQVMPGKTQLYTYTFKKPGVYTVECFEYCGLGHDAMRAEIDVVR